MAMPDFGAAAHVASVSYNCTFSQLTGAGGVVFSGSGTQFVFTFETGRTQPNPQIGLWDVTWDYSQFVQATVEADIAAALNSICGALASLLGLTLAQVQAACTIERIWTGGLNVQGNAAPQQLGPQGTGTTITETMTYP